MNATEVLAAISLARSLLTWSIKQREILQERGEWNDEQEAQWQRDRAAATLDPDFQPEPPSSTS